MTEKLYYHDSYTTSFEAKIIESFRVDDQLAVVLDRTFFYPTSGGQPFDTGTINGIPVVDVILRERDSAVIHVLADELWENDIKASIDWERRFDHMQQHSGQHILSAAFEKVAGANTIGFHLGAELATIDLDIQELGSEPLKRVEKLANEVVMSGLQVRTTIVPRTKIADIPLRKPPEVNGPVRVVEIEKYDLCACGGTHVKQTGEIGPIKIVGLENRSRGLRVSFLCGWRALRDYCTKHQLITRLAEDLSVGYWDVTDAVDRLRTEIKSLRSEKRQDLDLILDYEARDLIHSAPRNGDYVIVNTVFQDRDRHELNVLAQKITSHPDTIALLGIAGEKAHILFARADNIDRDMVMLLKTALRVLGSTAGGGRPSMAQGGGPAADMPRVKQALDRAERLLLAQR